MTLFIRASLEARGVDAAVQRRAPQRAHFVPVLDLAYATGLLQRLWKLVRRPSATPPEARAIAVTLFA
jgi:hypothetical protein